MSKTYFPIHVHSHYSLLDGLSKPEDIASRAEEIGATGCALTDHGSVCGHIDFLKAMNKKGLKPLLGCEFYICKNDAVVKNEENKKLAHLCVIAKNDAGWKDLIALVSIANLQEQYYYHPRISLSQLAEFAGKGNLMAYSGHIGSNMSNVLFQSDGSLSPSWREDGVKLAKWFEDTFGRGNFYLEAQLMDHIAFKKQEQITDCIRQISKDTGIPCVATQDAHYARKEDAVDQRVLLCANMNTTMQQASRPDFPLSGFFRSNNYHIPSYEEMVGYGYTEEEIENSNIFGAQVSKYEKILRAPILPKFNCPNNITADEYLKQLCREGWKAKIEGKVDRSKYQEYGDQVKHELSVLQGAGLSSYFLIVRDILQYVTQQNWLKGPGRGSAAGCLVSYLVDITAIDPMPYNLLFERFYNAGRNTADHVSMPDIDMDVPAFAREPVLQYIRNKYGHDKVGQMITFQTMKGKGALKAVLRAYGGVSFDEMNTMTKYIIEEHKISDELQKMKEETGDSSIIRWCLEHQGNKLEEWCRIDDHGNLSGPYAARFEQAMRMEGTKTSMSKHPAGIVIAPQPLTEMCPMVLDSESGLPICGFEMSPLEEVGGLKLDVLGIRSLDKLMGISQDLASGEIKEFEFG